LKARVNHADCRASAQAEDKIAPHACGFADRAGRTGKRRRLLLVHAPGRANRARRARGPVTIAAAASRDVPIYLDALGTTSAANTVTIRSQITGTLQTVNFTEGQEVKQGDTLAVIDPRPLQATLTQAQAKKAQDQALLISAQKDLARFRRAGEEGLRHAAEPRPAAGQGRPAQGDDRCRSRRDRQCADAALLRHDHGAV
jgi:multidrug efflux pump subunit AcrA (membrane-fusion protein)